ncbi:LysR family transcriptional regulator ArgP [Arthrobacter sp. zg-Y40]|uniref:LysR family transcriptional regulator ArgP n=1 Tax=Arthrobacter sp. zg-Y40 TaxID=2886939 RepID=UPI001D13DE17|nr:LysR family transcriptional regulator ArgP [Arthrobacter sp. zg-Y40]MCC3280358.1 LysR family transcriptional regulator ArgP [Arthrobacter sp. zg-Y40]
MNLEQLRALTAVVDEGTFEAAAERLHVSPSAVSQRIKALENAEGQIMVRRGIPCSPTEAGAVLLRMARQIQLLESEARTALSTGTGAGTSTPVAVNADSLATWFRPVLSEAAAWTDGTLELQVEDQDHSARLLRSGDVIGAVTADPVPVNGCRAELLGAMRYLPVATPALRQQYTGADGVSWDTMPVVRFNSKDDLQGRFLAARGVTGLPPRHTIPSSEAFLAAVRAGLGWGMLPELQLGTELDDGTLVLLDGSAYEDVQLYWQAWKLDSERLRRISAAIRQAAARLR